MRPVSGAELVGFSITEFPVIRAPMAMPFASMKGKLNGETTGQTPWGFSTSVLRSPGPPGPMWMAYPFSFLISPA